MALSQAFHERLKVIASTKPDLAFQNAIPLKDSKTAFRFTATHSIPASPLTRADYMEMVSTSFDKKLALVPDTLEIIGEKLGSQVVSGIIEANTEVKDYKEDDVRKMRSISANVFMDEEDSIWKVVESNGIKCLVQSIKEDFSDIVAARLARRGNSVHASNFSGVVPASGDYIAYYNSAGQAISWGFALVSNDLQVIDRQLKEFVTITPASVVVALDGSCLEKAYSMAKFINDNNQVLADDFSRGDYLANYLDYAKTLFAGTPYFKKLEELVAKRKHFGNTGISPISTFNNI